MSRISQRVCIAALIVLSAVPLAGQDRPDADELVGGAVVVTDERQIAREMIEDVEILRYILARSVRELYSGQSGGPAASAAGMMGDMMMDAYGGAGDEGMETGAYDSYGMDEYAGGYEEYDSGYGPPEMSAMAEGMDMYGSTSGTSVRRAWTAALGAGQVHGPLASCIEDCGVVFQLEVPPLLQYGGYVRRLDSSLCTYLQKSQWQRAALELKGDVATTDCRQCHDLPQNLARAGEGRVNLDQWKRHIEQNRRQRVRQVSAGGPSREQLTERLGGLLAENGHNFRHLPSDQRVTIAVTIRPRPPSRAAAGGVSGSMVPGVGGVGPGTMPAPGAGSSPMGAGSYPGFSGGAYAAGEAGDSRGERYEDFYGTGSTFGTSRGFSFRTRGQTGAPGRSSFGAGSAEAGTVETPDSGSVLLGGIGEAGSDELTGDLLMRQGRVNEAGSAYLRAVLEAVGSAKEKDKDKPLARSDVQFGKLGRPWTAVERRLFQKLLAAYVAAGLKDHARKLLDNWPDESAGSSAAASFSDRVQRDTPLPARLVVSATGKQLGDVAAGRMSRILFRQVIQVRYFDPQAPDPAATSGDDQGSAHQPAAAPVEGVVLDVSGDDQLLELSIGKQHGIYNGLSMLVTRDTGSGQVQLGTAEIISIRNDRSVARITSHAETGDATDGTVRRGDHVIAAPGRSRPGSPRSRNQPADGTNPPAHDDAP